MVVTIGHDSPLVVSVDHDSASVVFGGDDSRTPPIIGLCAWQDDREWKAEDLADRIRTYRKLNGGLDKIVDNPQYLVIGVLKQVRLNTLDNAILEIDAGRFWITKDLRESASDNLENGFISRKNWKRFLKKIIENTDPVLDPIHRKEQLEGRSAIRSQPR